MAGILMQSPVPTTVIGLENGELRNHTSRSGRRVSRTTIAGVIFRVDHGANARSTSCTDSGRKLQRTLTGTILQKTSDSLVLRYGKDFPPVFDAGAIGLSPLVRRTMPRATTVASLEGFIEESTTPTLVAQEDSRSSSCTEPISIPSFESEEPLSPGQIPTSKVVDGIRSSSLVGPGVVPGYITSKRREKSVSKNTVDRWMAPGKVLQVKQLLDTLDGVHPSIEGVQAVMQGWRSSISPRDIVTVISALNWKVALPFFKWLQLEGYNLNIVAYNVLIGTFRAGRVWNVADEFAQQMIIDGVKLDNYTYSTLISCALQCNAPVDAMRWYEKMSERGCIPDEVTYSNMALVYSRLGRYDDAVDLYERLRATGWKPDKVSFGTMVNVYSRGGDYVKASAIIREMNEAGLNPDAVVYNTLIRHFAREGKTGQAKRVFMDMERAGVRPSEYTLSLMIDVHGRAGETKEAFQLFTRLKEEKLPLDVVVYNSLLKMCAEERLVKEAENILAGMVGRGIKPDSVTYKSVINLYAKEGKVKEAEKFANKMVEVGFSLDVVVYSCLMRACGISKDFKRVETFFREMVADGCIIDDRCCGVLLSMMNLCDTEEDMAVVQRCLLEARPSLGRIVCLLRAETVQLTELQEQIQILLNQSNEDSHRPFCNGLVDVCWKSGAKERAQQVLALADSLGVYPGGLRTKSDQLWVLHLRSLSFSAAECGLDSWIGYLKEEVKQGQELPLTLAIETGAGRNKEDIIRLYNVILSKLNDMHAPFEPSLERIDWLVSAGPACTLWLQTEMGSELAFCPDLELCPESAVN